LGTSFIDRLSTTAGVLIISSTVLVLFIEERKEEWARLRCRQVGVDSYTLRTAPIYRVARSNGGASYRCATPTPQPCCSTPPFASPSSTVEVHPLTVSSYPFIRPMITLEHGTHLVSLLYGLIASSELVNSSAIGTAAPPCRDFALARRPVQGQNSRTDGPLLGIQATRHW
jgi:hypothetical protein